MCWQQEEVSEELLTFHQVMNKMQEMEEEVQDDHKSMVEVSSLASFCLDCYRVSPVKDGLTDFPELLLVDFIQIDLT